MRRLTGLAMLALFALPTHASNPALYERLQGAEYMRGTFVAKRTPRGLDFASKETFRGASGTPHPQRHIEIEGPLRIAGADTLRASVESLIPVIEPEVDTGYRKDENTQNGLNIDVVDINGAQVAFLTYRSAREDDTFIRRAVLHTAQGVYVLAMSLHGAKPDDRAGMYLEMLTIDMLNSGQLEGAAGRIDPPWLKRGESSQGVGQSNTRQNTALR